MTRTDEQHLADVAAHTLRRLAWMYDDFEHLHSQLCQLADYAADNHPDLQHEFLIESAMVAKRFTCCVPEVVRDLASRLPIRGLDFNDRPCR